MSRPGVKRNEPAGVKREYRSALREEQAAATRRRVRDAAEALFLERGYGGTSMADVAAAAGVSRPTVFNSFGSKLALLKEVVDVRMAGDDAPVELSARPLGKRIATAADAEEAIRLQARYASEVIERAAPMMVVLLDAATTDDEGAALLHTYEEGRLHGVGAVVDRLVELGALRPGLSADKAKEAVWLLSGPEPWRLAQRRGWSRAAYERWFRDCLRGVLLDPAEAIGSGRPLRRGGGAAANGRRSSP